MNRDEREVDDRNATAMNQAEVEVEGIKKSLYLTIPTNPTNKGKEGTKNKVGITK